MITRKNITQERRLPCQLDKIQQSSLKSNRSGFTIIESLIAMVVVAILMVAIAPVLALSVATRVQARRMEVATQAARAYINGLRSGIISPTPSTINSLQDFKAYAAPTSSGSLTCTANSYCQVPMNNLYCVTLFGNTCSTSSSNSSRNEMLIQAFRLNQASADPDKGYLLGLRVYRVDAFKESGTLKKGIKQPTFTSGLGDRKAPLVEMTTEIVVINKTKYQDLCARLSGCEE